MYAKLGPKVTMRSLIHLLPLLVLQVCVTEGSNSYVRVDPQVTVGEGNVHAHFQRLLWTPRAIVDDAQARRPVMSLRQSQSWAGIRGGSTSGRSPLPSKPLTFPNMLKATRPWTWTAGLIPVLLTATLMYKDDDASVDKGGLVRTLVMAISLQASANLVNSYVDYNHWVDTVEAAGDRTIVDGYMSPKATLWLAVTLFGATCAAVVPMIRSFGVIGTARELGVIFWLGVGMAFSYSCWPFRLKYRGLGDMTVFLVFGPMLMQVAALLISGSTQHWVLPYGLPAALLCEAILHANNMRDMAQDRKAGIYTLPMLLGFRGSQIFYWALISSAYTVTCGLAMLRYKGCALVLLTLPLAMSALKACKIQTVRDLDETTAKLHLMFGMCMIAGGMLFA